MPYRIAYLPFSKDSFGIEIGCLKIYFSFNTPIAFRLKEHRHSPLYVSENIWGNNTEKHLCQIKGLGPSQELKRKDFEHEFKRAYNKNFIICANQLLKEKFHINTEVLEESSEGDQNEPNQNFR